MKKKFNPFRYLKIDMDKPVSFQQQLAVMFTFLFVACILFTVVYVIRMASPDDNTAAPASAQESSAQTSSPSKQEEQSEPEQSVPEKTKVEISTGALSDQGETEILEKYYDDIYDGSLILVNKDYSCRSDGENVVSLLETKSDSFAITDGSVSLDPSAASKLNEMMDDFQEACGENAIMVASGYQSYELQASLFSSSDESDSSLEAPGYNESQTGFALELALTDGSEFDGKGIYSWIGENCAEYGFIQVKPDSDPGYLRYVGLPHSIYMKDNKLTLGQYLEVLSGHNADNAMIIKCENGDQWYVCYSEADLMAMSKVTVPSDMEYDLSGDNFSGFIVTVKTDSE